MWIARCCCLLILCLQIQVRLSSASCTQANQCDNIASCTTGCTLSPGTTNLSLSSCPIVVNSVSAGYFIQRAQIGWQCIRCSANNCNISGVTTNVHYIENVCGEFGSGCSGMTPSNPVGCNTENSSCECQYVGASSTNGLCTRSDAGSDYFGNSNGCRMQCVGCRNNSGNVFYNQTLQTCAPCSGLRPSSCPISTYFSACTTTSDATCVPCSLPYTAFCQQCNQSHCLECESPTSYLNTSAGNCSACASLTPNCIECSSAAGGQCTRCSANYYLSTPAPGAQPTCELVSQCTAYQIMLAPATLVSNTYCVACNASTLNLGAGCATCGVASTPYIANEYFCITCLSSQYYLTTDPVLNVRVCAPCSTGPCPSPSYVATPCAAASDRQCATCSGCGVGQTIAVPCSTTMNTVCQPCLQCPAFSFASLPCSNVISQNTICTPCTHAYGPNCSQCTSAACAVCSGDVPAGYQFTVSPVNGSCVLSPLAGASSSSGSSNTVLIAVVVCVTAAVVAIVIALIVRANKGRYHSDARRLDHLKMDLLDAES